MIKINIAKEFTDTPGGRFKKDGKFSGEEFREEILIPLSEKNEKILIDLDGGYGYPTCFLEEAFGGLARKFGSKKVLKTLEFKSDEEPLLITEIISYIT